VRDWPCSARWSFPLGPVALGQEFDEKKYLALAQEAYAQASDHVMSITMPFGTSRWGVRKKTVSSWTPPEPDQR
jgi:hypothetical protein